MSVLGFGVKFVEYGKRSTAVCSGLLEMLHGKDLTFWGRGGG